MMSEQTVFIYAKGKEIKALDLEDAEAFKGHVADGWQHIHTLNVCAWIEYLSKCKDKDILKEIRGLSHKNI